MRFRKASDFKALDVEWLWNERIPRSMISFVAGKPEQRKGILACHIAAAVTREGGKVIYSAMEDAEGLMTRPRLEAAGADLDRVSLEKFVLPTNTVELCDHILDEGIDLVIIDPLASHLQGATRHSDKIRQVLAPVQAAIEAAECGLLIVEHVNKKVTAGAHPLTAIAGTGSGLPAACRMGFFFGMNPDNEEQFILSCIKSNIRERPEDVTFETDNTDIEIETKQGQTIQKSMPLLVIDSEEGRIDPIRLVQSKVTSTGKVGRPDDKRAAAAEWLTKYLMKAGGPVKATTIYEDAKQDGMMDKTLKRAANDMGIVRYGKGRAIEWDLSDEVKDVIAEAEESVKEGATDTAETSAEETVKATIKVKPKSKGKPNPQQPPPPKVDKDEMLTDEEIATLMAEMSDKSGDES